jgi:hypothetical protein
MSAALGVDVVEDSDGRSVTELFRDEEMLGNGQNTMCSRVLKAERGEAFVKNLKSAGFDVIKVVGYSASEPKRVNRMVGHADREGISVRFPIIEEGVTKQQCADWCSCEMHVQPSAMYQWSDHANCVGCVKGGRAYWLLVHKNHPEVFEQRARLEEEFGHTIIRGGDREHVTLRELVKIGLKRPVGQRERIEIGACDCGD